MSETPRENLESLTPRKIPILVVDDEPGIREAVALYLRRRGFQVEDAGSGVDALRILAVQRFPLILCDISLPGDCSGLDLLHFVKEHNPDTVVMMMTGHLDVDFAIRALKEGAFDYFKKPFLFEEIEAAIGRAVEQRTLLDKARQLQQMRQSQHMRVEYQTQFLVSVASMIDAKSPFTRSHGDRVAIYARSLGQELGLSGTELSQVSIGGKLHDIGKIGTPEHILNKPGPLTDEERAIIQQHPVCGADLVQPVEFMEPYLPMIRSHHENWDGKGYPDGLAGEQIPVTVQVVKIADYYDAITSQRPYRQPMSMRQACETLEQESGRAFQPELVERFLRLIEHAPWVEQRREPAGA